MVIGTGNIRAPKKRRRVIDDLVEAHRGEIGELHFDDGPHAFDGRADGRTNDGILADRRIDDATGKFFRQIFGGFERAAEIAHILPVDINPRIVRQRLGLRFTDGFEIGDAHSLVPTALCNSNR